jgi:VWFA-related protein
MSIPERDRLGRWAGALLMASASTVALASAAFARQQPTFRSVVDLIAVDVQVVGSDGTPIEQLDPGAFEVSIEGRSRKVVSAQFVRQAADGASPRKLTSSAPPLPSDAPPGADGRTFIIAIDNGSFEAGTTREAINAIRNFVGHVEPNDLVGLYVYPTGGWIAPSLQRATLRAALDRVFGEKQTLQSHYNLSPWEIVDITAEAVRPNSVLTAQAARAANPLAAAIAEPLNPLLRIAQRECPDDAQCPKRIYAEGMELGVQLEHQTHSSMAGLEILLRELATIPGRKYVVLVSTGVLVSDRLDGRPNAGDLATVMGQKAAQAHATLYTVHVDINSANPNAPSKRGSVSLDLSRDRAMFSNWLDDFSRAAGGMRIYVPVGGGGFAFDRVLRESSAYYLLGVEPAEADRDGRPRQLHVKVAKRGTIVRSRQWVLIPARSK